MKMSNVEHQCEYKPKVDDHLAVRLTHQQRIAFTPSSIIVPKSRWSREEQIIEYRRIKALSTSEMGGQRFLHVTHADGNTIDASMLSSKATFEISNQQHLAQVWRVCYLVWLFILPKVAPSRARKRSSKIVWLRLLQM